AAGEDTELGLRAVEAGADAVYLAEALVHHDVRPSSLRAAMREATKWVDIPLLARLHPVGVRPLLHSRRWWRRTHPVTVLATIGLAGAKGRPWLLLLAVPWLRLRTGELQVNARRRHWAW